MNLQALQYRKTSHLLHFILFLFTAGFWIVPWICFVLYNRSYNQRIDLAVMANDGRQETRRESNNRRAVQRHICTCESQPNKYCEGCGR